MKPPRSPHIELICVGSELLSGKINTHTAFFGKKLFDLGFSLQYEHTVNDEPLRMKNIFTEAWKRADVVISAGGLGPTFDDITRECWADVLKRPLVRVPSLLQDIQAKFKKRGLEMPPHNARQAMILKGARILNNPHGTAPGQIFFLHKKTLVLLPGPTRELAPMVDQYVISHLKKTYGTQHSQQKTFLIFGTPESQIDHLIRPLVQQYEEFNGCRMTHGILASQGLISVKFRIEGPTKATVSKAYRVLSQQFRQVLNGYVFGEDQDTLPVLVGKHLLLRKKKLAVAESCTGGLLSKLLTDISGSSQYFQSGVVTYSNSSKSHFLGVAPKTLHTYGAVSEETALAMVKGLLKNNQGDYALSLTGIAGPQGGSAKKPVGLVYIGCATPHTVFVKKYLFKGDRDVIRHRAAYTALYLLLQELRRKQ